MANEITTDNINTKAQEVASLSDGDFVYVFKTGASGFSRIEKNLLLQGISGGGSGGGMSEEIYQAIQDNVNALRTGYNSLLSALAGIAFSYTPPESIEPFSWPDIESSGDGGGDGGGDAPQATPSLVLAAPSGGWNFTTTVNTTVTKTFKVTGSNLVGAISLAIPTNSQFVLSGDHIGRMSVSGGNTIYPIAASIANGEHTITVSYRPSSTSGDTVTMTISSSGATSKTATLRGLVQSGVDTYSVQLNTSGLSNCTATSPTSVIAGDPVTVYIIPNTGFTLDGVTATVSATYGTVGMQQYDSGNDRISVTVSNINHDTLINVEATAISIQPVPTGYAKTDDLRLHLDGLNKGSDNTCWTDLVHAKRFIYYGNPEVVSNGVKFTYVPDPDDDPQPENWQYAHYQSRVSYEATDRTVEICFTPHKDFNDETTALAFFGSRAERGAAVTFNNGFAFAACKASGTDERKFKRALKEGESITAGNPVTLSMNANLFMLNGVQNDSTLLGTFLGVLSEITPKEGLIVGGMPRAGFDPTFIGCNATIHAVRIYDVQLSAEEMLNNQRYDNYRYSLDLPI